MTFVISPLPSRRPDPALFNVKRWRRAKRPSVMFCWGPLKQRNIWQTTRASEIWTLDDDRNVLGRGGSPLWQYAEIG